MTEEIKKSCIGVCDHCTQVVLASQEWTCRDGEGQEVDLHAGLLFHQDCWTYGAALDPEKVGWPKPSPDHSLSNKDRREQYSDLDVLKPLDGAVELAKELTRGRADHGETSGREGDPS